MAKAKPAFLPTRLKGNVRPIFGKKGARDEDKVGWADLQRWLWCGGGPALFVRGFEVVALLSPGFDLLHEFVVLKPHEVDARLCSNVFQSSPWILAGESSLDVFDVELACVELDELDGQLGCPC